MSDSLPLYTVKGEFRSAGESFGEIIRDGIELSVSRWCEDVATGGLDPRSYAAALAGQNGYGEALSNYAPRFLSFCGGVARGSNQSLYQVLAMNMMDEDWELRPRAVRHRLFSSVSQRCSTIAGPSASGFIGGQNMDIGGLVDGTQGVLKIEAADSGHDLYFLTVGAVPTCGFTSAGYALLLNTVAQLQPQPTGLPVCGVQFETLAQANSQRARDFLCRVQHAGGQCYTIVDAHSVIGHECGAHGAREVTRRHPNGVFTRTNHPLSDAPLRRVETEEDRYFLDRLGSSVERLAQIDEVVAAGSQLSVALTKDALSCRRSERDAVSREAGDTIDPVLGQSTINFTAGSLICEVDRSGDMRAHIAGGPPSCTPYRSFELC